MYMRASGWGSVSPTSLASGKSIILHECSTQPHASGMMTAPRGLSPRLCVHVPGQAREMICSQHGVPSMGIWNSNVWLEGQIVTREKSHRFLDRPFLLFPSSVHDFLLHGIKLQRVGRKRGREKKIRGRKRRFGKRKGGQICKQ